MSTKDFKVAIVGGGMCGLACAFGLLKAGIQVDVFEARPQFGEVGAGVGLGPNAVRALEALGILYAILARSEEASAVLRPFRFISGMDRHEHIYDYAVSEDDMGLGVHRATFIDAIIPLLDPNILHLNKRCIYLEPSINSKAMIIHFADGTTHEAHVIIGADGIKSTVRNFVIQDTHNHLVFTNLSAYRALIPWDTLKQAGVQTDLTIRPINFVGKNKHIIVFPIQSGRVINIVAFARDADSPISGELPHPWVQSVSEQELINEFVGWGNDVIRIVGCMPKPNKWSIHALRPPLSSYVRDRVVLIGDSAHGMEPHLGAGVGQGFEDTLLLSQLLSHPETTLDNIDRVLKAYDMIRLPRANMVLEASTRTGEIYESFDGNNAEAMRSNLADIWHPIWHHDLGDDLRRAIESLKNNITFKLDAVTSV